MTRRLMDDCFIADKPRLRHAEALAILKARIGPVADSEQLSLCAAAGRILAEPVIASRPVPAHTNAAVDGYSFATADYDRGRGCELTVAGRATAGHALGLVPGRGVAVRIFTGAVMPDGHDTVVMQEEASVRTFGQQTLITVPGGLKVGAN